MRTTSRFTTAALICLCSHAAALIAKTPTSSEDAYISGYVSAVLQIKFDLQHTVVDVHNGVVTLGDIPAPQEIAVRKTVRNINGVKAVKFTPPPGVQSNSSPPALPRENPGAMSESPQSVSPKAGNYKISMDTQAMEQAGVYHLPTGFLPPGRLFQPLIADPKWPVFSASYTHYSPYHPNGLKDVIPVSIGDTIPFERGDWPDQWQWEAGMQADAFAYFNMDTAHSDLQNTDFMVGGYFAARHRNFSFLIRYYQWTPAR